VGKLFFIASRTPRQVTPEVESGYWTEVLAGGYLAAKL